MAIFNGGFFPFLFFVSFAVFVPTLHASIGDFDEYWKNRAEQAHQDALKAFNPDPLNVTNQFNLHVNQ